MEEEEDFLDLGFDDGCYMSTWSLIEMWYTRSKKLQKLREKQEQKKKK